MKKTLIMLAAAALVLVGCDETNPEGTTIDSISIVPSSVEIPVSDSIGQALTLSWTPSTAPAPAEVIWATSDAAVVSVENGWIIPVMEGSATITATVGELQATCQVTVTGAFDLFKYGGKALVGIGDQVGSELYPITDLDGVTHTCALLMGEWYVYGDGIYLEGNSFAGADYVADVFAPIYYIVDSPDETAIGMYFGGDMFITPDTAGVTNYADSAYCAVAGEIADWDAYALFMDKYYWQGLEYTDEEAAAYLKSLSGAVLFKIDFNERKQFVEEGLIKYAILSDAENYIMDIEWFTGFYGLKLEESTAATASEDGFDIVRNPYEYVSVAKHYEQITASEVVARRAVTTPKYTKALDVKKMQSTSLKELRHSK